MIVIADSSPLNYLILIEYVEVLAPLYTRIVVPETVTRELKREPAPAVVKAWIAHPPKWLDVAYALVRAASRLVSTPSVARVRR